jgi:TrmH family RNA methyltransferase
MRVKEVASAQNPWFKEVKNLIEKNRFRKKQGRFTVEGLKEIELALKAGFSLSSIAYVGAQSNINVLDLPDGAEHIILSVPLMNELCVRGEVNNALAVFDFKEVTASPQSIRSIVIVEKVEKPGNLGAILRTAEAAGIGEIWLCDAQVDPFHPQVIRNSLGTVFHVPIKSYTFEECIQQLELANIQVFTTFMDEAVLMYDADFTQDCAVVLGTEHEGVTERWRHKGQNVQIPMHGNIDSLNVSVAGALLMYEIVRQRRK